VFAHDGIAYDKVTQQRWFTAGQNRQATIGLFHPSPFLVQKTNPLAQNIASLGDAKRLIRQQLRTALSEIGINIVKESSNKPLWKLLAQLDKKSGSSEWTVHCWWNLHHSVSSTDSADTGMGQLLKDWESAGSEPIHEVSHSQFEELANHALNSPGVIVGRALLRHWDDAVTSEGFKSTLNASWLGLRNYLDQRWF